jgi:hypothetical protein
MRGQLRWAWGGLLVGLLAGCGGDGKMPRVEGRVYYRGTPLTGGTIVFSPDPERGGHGPLASAVIGADGRYTLHTGGEPGAVAGWHRVTVAPAGVEGRPPEPPLPRHYADPERSGHCYEVKPGQLNVIEINLE